MTELTIVCIARRLAASALTWGALTSPALAQIAVKPVPGEAFQGLSWGASEEAVQERFPSAQRKKLLTCDIVPEAAKRWREAGLSCQALAISNYRVNSFVFDVEFFLAEPSLSLVGVSLTSMVQMDLGTPQLRPELMAKCGGLRDLLTERYGRGDWLVASNNPDEFRQETRWIQGAVMVNLTCTAHRNTLFLNVGYSPNNPRGAGKL